MVLRILGFSLWEEGRIDQALTIAQSLLAAIESRSDPWGEGMCLTLLSACQLESGDVEAAEGTILTACAGSSPRSTIRGDGR